MSTTRTKLGYSTSRCSPSDSSWPWCEQPLAARRALDLTENNLYTLGEGTRDVLDGIQEPINLYFFFSNEATEQLPTLRRTPLASARCSRNSRRERPRASSC